MPLTRNILHFARVRGRNLEERSQPFHGWVKARRRYGLQPFGRSLLTSPTEVVRAASDDGRELKGELVNFASHDYLGLGRDSRVLDAAKRATDEFGAHSGGTPVMLGRHPYSLELEQRLSSLFRREACTLYPTGWAAGYSAMAALVQKSDFVVLDSLAHNCLQVGARFATDRILQFRHNDVGNLTEQLKVARQSCPGNAVFVVVESLYSMDSDSPDLRAVIDAARAVDAITVIDVSHDVASMGLHGLGLLESVDYSSEPDIIMGSLSKALGSNGGFVVSSAAVRDYLFYHSHPFMFSSNISPVQSAVSLKYIDIAYSEEGDRLRSAIHKNATHMRNCLETNGLEVMGITSPIVPVLVGEEGMARVACRLVEEEEILVNLIEFPAVPLGKARFRLQVRPKHDQQTIERSAHAIAEGVSRAGQMVLNQAASQG